MVSDADGRFHLDGGLLSTVVWRDRQTARQISHLQRFQSQHPGLTQSAMLNFAIQSDRLIRELHHLAQFTDCPPTQDATLPAPTQAVTRVVFTSRDLEARAWLKQLAADAGFAIRE